MKVMLRSFQHLYLSPSWWLSVSLIWRFLTENTCAPPGQKVRRLNKMSLSILLPKMSKKQYHPIFNLRQCLTGDPNSPSSRFWSPLPTNLPLSGELPSRRGGRIYGLNQDYPIHSKVKPFQTFCENKLTNELFSLRPSSNVPTLGWHLCFACPLPWIWERWALWLLMYRSLAHHHHTICLINMPTHSIRHIYTNHREYKYFEYYVASIISRLNSTSTSSRYADLHPVK